MSNSEFRTSVGNHYDTVADDYHERYQRENLHDTSRAYPANYFRLQLLLNSFISKGIKRVIEVGVGEGTPLSTLGTAGIDVWGFDVSPKMVEASKRVMETNGMRPNQIFWGDIEDPTTYASALKDGLFDGLMAMGVLPHVENDDMVIENISTMIRPGGTVFVEFRNKLFSLFTFNRHTVDFIVNDLLQNVSKEVKSMVENDLNSRLRIDMPPYLNTNESQDQPSSDPIVSKFHNPFEISELFENHGFENIRMLWYHYHPAMPYLDEQIPVAFRNEAIRLEHEPSSWRGYFLSSAFVVEAVKKGG